MSKIAIDLDGTISADPQFYKDELTGMMKAGHEVHVLTGNPQAEHVLAQKGFVRGREFTRIATVPRKHIASAKVAYMQSTGITHLIDNRKANIKAARKAGIVGHWHAKPKGPG